MTIVVTGAAGHVGTNLCLALLADGHEVRAVDLREPVRAVRHGARWVRADIRDVAAIGPALEGCEIVYHLAAVISIAGGLRGLVHSVNVDGVRILARTALERGVPRFVHCSSVHAFDLAAVVDRTVDESAPRALRPQLPAYDRSKAAGEVELRRVVDCGLDAVVVNPTGIIGPFDDTPSRMGPSCSHCGGAGCRPWCRAGSTGSTSATWCVPCARPPPEGVRGRATWCPGTA